MKWFVVHYQLFPLRANSTMRIQANDREQAKNAFFATFLIQHHGALRIKKVEEDAQ